MNIKFIRIVFSTFISLLVGGYFLSLILSMLPDVSATAQYFMIGWWTAAFPGFGLYFIYRYWQGKHHNKV